MEIRGEYSRGKIVIGDDAGHGETRAMNRKELKQKLDALNVPPAFYSLDGELLPDRIVLYHNYSNREVFYFDERGNRNNEKVFPSESDACHYIYEYFKKQKEIEKKYQ